jgi:hypothetical protein
MWAAHARKLANGQESRRVKIQRGVNLPHRHHVDREGSNELVGGFRSVADVSTSEDIDLFRLADEPFAVCCW